MKCILKMIGVCLIAIFAGTIALMAAYGIPTNQMYRHLQKDKFMIEREGDHFAWANKPHTMLDGYTDSLMLMNAVYPVDSVSISALAVRRWYIDNESPSVSLAKALENKEAENLKTTTYPRYWHGYLVYLKPMLFMGSYHDFRMINAYLQFILMGLLLFLFYKKLSALYTIAFFITLWFINPITVAMSLQLSSVFYVMLISVFLILWKNEFFMRKNLYMYFFLVVGILTSYLDLLTYPVVTIGIPLLVYTLVNKDTLNKETNVFLSQICYSFAWGFGYITMWFGKCLVTWIIYGYSILPDMIDAALNRTSSQVRAGEGAGAESLNFIMVLQENIKAATNSPWIFLFLIFALYLFYRILKRRSLNFSKRMLVSFTLVGIFPLVWYALMQNHSFIHADFLTYRDLAVLFFSIFCIEIEFFSNEIEENV